MPPDGSGRRATSYDVAQAAGVSQPTVSRSFKPASNISPATRTRVLAAAERLGYTPNALARSLITQRSELVGVIVTRYTLRGNPDVTYALGESLRAAGKQMILIAVESEYPAMELLWRTLEYPLAGIISCALIDDAQLGALRARDMPIILFNRTSERIQVDHVTSNHRVAAAALARLLVEAGHRRFLCIGGPATAWVSRQRIDGFLDGLGERGITPLSILETDFSYAGGRNRLLEQVATGNPPDAVLCANDQLALGVMDACRFELGWRIPDQISVTGFDDIAEAERPVYRLTTMRQESVEMAKRAVALLLDRLEAPTSEPNCAIIDAKLVDRGSARLIDPG